MVEYGASGGSPKPSARLIVISDGNTGAFAGCAHSDRAAMLRRTQCFGPLAPLSTALVAQQRDAEISCRRTVACVGIEPAAAFDQQRVRSSARRSSLRQAMAGRSTGSYGEITVADRSGSGPFSRLGASLVLTAANLCQAAFHFLRGWGLAKMPHVPVIAQKNRLQALGALCPCQPRHIRRLWVLVFDKKSKPAVDCAGQVIALLPLK